MSAPAIPVTHDITFCGTSSVSLEFTYELDIIEKACFSRSKGGKFNRPVKVDLVHVASAVINRIAPQGSHRYSRRGHNTIVLQGVTVSSTLSYSRETKTTL